MARHRSRSTGRSHCGGRAWLEADRSVGDTPAAAVDGTTDSTGRPQGPGYDESCGDAASWCRARQQPSSASQGKASPLGVARAQPCASASNSTAASSCRQNCEERRRGGWLSGSRHCDRHTGARGCLPVAATAPPLLLPGGAGSGVISRTGTANSGPRGCVGGPRDCSMLQSAMMLNALIGSVDYGRHKNFRKPVVFGF